MELCKCLDRYTNINGVSYPICLGTQEKERCHCLGDRTKCDFYPEVREKAKKEQTNSNIKKELEKINIEFNRLQSENSRLIEDNAAIIQKLTTYINKPIYIYKAESTPTFSYIIADTIMDISYNKLGGWIRGYHTGIHDINEINKTLFFNEAYCREKCFKNDNGG